MPNHFPSLVSVELGRARANHGRLNSAHEAYAVILEELEEFQAEVFKKRHERNRTDMLGELVQIGAMAQRAAEDLGLVGAGHSAIPDPLLSQS